MKKYEDRDRYFSCTWPVIVCLYDLNSLAVTVLQTG